MPRAVTHSSAPIKTRCAAASRVYQWRGAYPERRIHRLDTAPPHAMRRSSRVTGAKIRVASRRSNSDRRAFFVASSCSSLLFDREPFFNEDTTQTCEAITGILQFQQLLLDSAVERKRLGKPVADPRGIVQCQRGRKVGRSEPLDDQLQHFATCTVNVRSGCIARQALDRS